MANKSAEHSHFPWKHIVGFILSIVLTLLALWVAVYTDLSSSAKLWIIFGFAFIQAALQLLMFMHMTESENGTIKSETRCSDSLARSLSYLDPSGFSRLTITMVTIWTEILLEALNTQSIQAITNNTKNPLPMKRVFCCLQLLRFLRRYGRP